MWVTNTHTMWQFLHKLVSHIIFFVNGCNATFFLLTVLLALQQTGYASTIDTFLHKEICAF